MAILYFLSFLLVLCIAMWFWFRWRPSPTANHMNGTSKHPETTRLSNDVDAENASTRNSRIAIPIYATAHDAKNGEWYRKSNDDSNVIRVRYKKPTGANHIIMRDVKISGISRPEYASVAISFLQSKGHQLSLVKDPSNPYDQNAIKILAHWSGSSAQIGWVPKDLAAELADEDYLGASLNTIFLPGSGRSLGIRIDIWR